MDKKSKGYVHIFIQKSLKLKKKLIAQNAISKIFIFPYKHLFILLSAGETRIENRILMMDI